MTVWALSQKRSDASTGTDEAAKERRTATAAAIHAVGITKSRRTLSKNREKTKAAAAAERITTAAF